MVLKDVGAKENGAKVKIIVELSTHHVLIMELLHDTIFSVM